MFCVLSACVVALLFFASPIRADETSPTDTVAALTKLGARITLDEQGRVIVVHLGERKVADDDLVHLRGLAHLQELDLTRTKITGSGLAHLKEATALKKLFLTDTRVDDAAVAHLAGVKDLELIGLSGTKITDAGLGHLEGLAKLKQLYCLGTNVTDAGAEKLRRALPQCDVTR